MDTQQKNYEVLEARIKELEAEVQRMELQKDSVFASFYNSIFTTSHIIQLVIDPSTGKIVAANNAACQFYGYTHGEISTMYIYQINTTPPEQLKIEMQNVREGHKNFFNFNHQLKNGQIKQVEVQSWAVKVANQDLLFSIVHDITQQKEMEMKLCASNKLLEDKIKELTFSEEKFSQLFNHSSVAMALSTIDTGIYIDINAEFLRLSGYDREEVIGHSPAEFKLWEKIEERDRIVNDIKEHGALRNHKVNIRTKSGEILTMLCAGEMLEINNRPCIFISAYDITEQEKAEQQLMLHNYAMNHAPQSIFWANKEGQFVYVNENGYSSLGYSLKEILKMRIWDVDTFFSAASWAKFWDRLAEMQTQIHSAYSAHQRKDGSQIPVQVRATYLKYGEHEYVIGYVNDITEHVKTIDKL